MARGLVIHRKRSINYIAIVFWLLLVVLLSVTGWYTYRWYMEGELPPIVSAKSADPRVDETIVSDKQIDEYTVPATHPRYISIPSLGVKARVFAVGVDAKNQLQAPKNISDAVWYDKSALPGDGYGAILMDAHNGGITRDGVFAKLNTLAKGAEIMIERGDGKQFTYKVVENQSMSLEEANKTGMQMMMKSADPEKEGLNLITCDGKYVPRLQQFDRRIMLRAVIAD